MSVQLLDKTRKINKLLHNNNSSKVVFNDICEVLTGILDSDILVISRKGKVLGSSICKGVDELQELIVDEVGGFIDAELNERLLGILSTKENVNLETLGFGENSRSDWRNPPCSPRWNRHPRQSNQGSHPTWYEQDQRQHGLPIGLRGSHD